RPSWLVTSQQGAACDVWTAPLITFTRPSWLSEYDHAEPVALDTSRLPCLSKSKPNGVPPVHAKTAAESGTSWSTKKVSIELDAFSVMTSTWPSRSNEI